MDLKLKLRVCFITVDDHEKALAFYRDVLDLQVVNDVSFEQMRWLTLTPPARQLADRPARVVNREDRVEAGIGRADRDVEEPHLVELRLVAGDEIDDRQSAHP